MRVVAVLLMTAPAALGQTPMSPEDFDAWSTGKTLAYSVDGTVYGAEAYFPGRRVRDADTGGPCLDGTWFADGGAVCFVYPARDGIHCWTYWREGDAIFARPVQAAPEEPAQRVSLAETPLSCPGPEVGA